MPVMESKAADVFAFGMFAVEVFTGKIPFEEQKNEAVVLRISQGGRPEMPRNAQALGLTAEMWSVLESCWQQNSKKRPPMQEVVRKWQRFVRSDDDLNTFPEEPQSAAEPVEGASRRRAKTVATQPQLQMKTDPPRNRTMSENVASRTKPETSRLRTSSAIGKTGLGAIPQSPNSETTEQSTKPEVIRQRPKVEVTHQRPKVEVSQPTQVYDPPPTPKRKFFCCGLF